MQRDVSSRQPDGQPPRLALAVPALWKGILHEPDCLEAAWDLVKRWSWGQRLSAYHDAHREGLQARVGRISLLDFARELLNIAWQGLEKQRALDSEGRDETIYLKPLDQQLRSGASPGRYTAEHWERSWNQDVKYLIAFASYREDD